jgi:hypothetical protein
MSDTWINAGSDVSKLLQRANRPLDRLLGAVQTLLRLPHIHWLLKKRPDPLVISAVATEEDFMRENRHLGANMLRFYLNVLHGHALSCPTIVQPAGLPQSLDLSDREKTLCALEIEEKYAPAIFFETQSLEVWERLVLPGAMAALRMAHQMVTRVPNCRDFTLKELVRSDDVLDAFARVVAFQFRSAADAAGTGSCKGQSSGSSKYYINMLKMQDGLSDELEHILVWFESVRAIEEPLRAECKKDQGTLALCPVLPARRLVYRG